MPEMTDSKTILHAMNVKTCCFFSHVGVDAGGVKDADYASHVNDVKIQSWWFWWLSLMLRPNVLNVSIMPSQEVGFHEATHVILLDTFQWWGDVDEGPVAEPFAWLLAILFRAAVGDVRPGHHGPCRAEVWQSPWPALPDYPNDTRRISKDWSLIAAIKAALSHFLGRRPWPQCHSEMIFSLSTIDVGVGGFFFQSPLSMFRITCFGLRPIA